MVIDTQKEVFGEKEADLKREALEHVPVVNSFATVITGVRRCGKSTLLLQVFRAKYNDAFYFNFDDIIQPPRHNGNASR